MRHLGIICALLVCSCQDAGEVERPPVFVMDSSVVVNEDGLVPDLVCPGVPGCESGEGRFAIGVAKKDITPELDGDAVWIAGFGMGRQATGIHDPIWVRALSITRGDVRLGLAVLDVVGFFHDEVLAVRHGAKDLGFDHIMVASTHNHETGDTMGIWGPDIVTTGVDAEYLKGVVAQTVSALGEARAGERPADMTWATTAAPERVSDSRSPEVIDQRLHAFAFHNADDGVFASLVVWGNHPESLGGGNTEITSDYPHYLRQKMEAEYPGSTAVFFNGILGGLTNPLGVRGCPDEQGNATCKTGTFEKAEYIGDGAAEAAIAALAHKGALVKNPGLSFRRRGVLMPTSNIVMIGFFGLGLVRRSVVSEEGRVLPPEDARLVNSSELYEGRVKLQTEVNAFRIGPAAFLAVPGELYAELWLEGEDGGSYVEVPQGADYPGAAIDPPLESYLPDTAPHVIINQANDALGYIIPKTQWDVEEPRAYEEDGQYGEENSTGHQTAVVLNAEVKKLYALQPE